VNDYTEILECCYCCAAFFFGETKFRLILLLLSGTVLYTRKGLLDFIPLGKKRRRRRRKETKIVYNAIAADEHEITLS